MHTPCSELRKKFRERSHHRLVTMNSSFSYIRLKLSFEVELSNENAFWPLLVFIRGASKSVSQFLKFTISRVEFLVNKVER